MMRTIESGRRCGVGAKRPEAGVLGPRSVSGALALWAALLGAGCGAQETNRNLDPQQVGLTPAVAPIFDDGETKLFEVKRGLPFPILQPDATEAGALNQRAVEPYGRMPWVTNRDVKVQLTWTLSNLDEQSHVVEVLVDPWNEFGRYFPGMQLTNAAEQEFQPNSSGIDHLYVVEGKGAGDASRRHGTYTFDDMNEMAVDFATVQAMIKTPPPLPGGAPSDPEAMTDPLPTYANHAFNFQNHSYDDPLIEPYIPAVIAGLTGIDFGVRTTEPATVALEIQIEIVDLGQRRVQEEGSDRALLLPTARVVTVGSALP